MQTELKALHEATTQRYAACSRYARSFVWHKLRIDPVFFALLRGGCLPDRGRLYDLGCGYGILSALTATARDLYTRGEWPAGWPPPPQQLEVRGVDLSAGRIRAARMALNGAARFEHADLRRVALAPCSAIVVLDVMLYFDPREQESLLAAAAATLEPGGVLLLREANAAGGMPFQVTQWAERAAGLIGARPRWRLHYRSAADWAALLESLGFAVEVEPMSRGTPFANVLYVARRSPRPSRPATAGFC